MNIKILITILIITICAPSWADKPNKNTRDKYSRFNHGDSSHGRSGRPVSLPIDQIYDGDTIKTHFKHNQMPYPLNYTSIRVAGIDTPEKPAASFNQSGKLGRAGCEKEAILALAATMYLTEIARYHKNMTITNYSWGKYARIIADVKIGNTDVGEAMIQAGFAVPYSGGTKTKDWCK